MNIKVVSSNFTFKSLNMTKTSTSKVKIDAYFNNEIEDAIIKYIKKAKRNIFLAVAWISNPTLIKELIDKSNQRKVKINILVDCDISNYKNTKGKTDNIKFITKGKNINFYVWYHINISGNDKFYNLMHNKFCIIDDRVITGSYNWTNKAKFNRENIVVIKDKSIARNYKEQFKNMINTNETKGSDDRKWVKLISKKSKFKKAFRHKNKANKKARG